MIELYFEDDYLHLDIDGRHRAKHKFAGRNRSTAPDYPEAMHIYFSTGIVLAAQIDDDYPNSVMQQFGGGKYWFAGSFYCNPSREDEKLRIIKAGKLNGYSDLVQYWHKDQVDWVGINQHHHINYAKGDWR